MISGTAQLDSAARRDVASPSPDLAPCDACLREVSEPASRRFRYPFTTCVCCGPRFSVLPWPPARSSTTPIHGFQMCAACREEHENRADRRFAYPLTCCPACGPHSAWQDAQGTVLARREDAISAAATSIRSGKIVAVMGICGFHLVADAGNRHAVITLRGRFAAPDTPLPVMIPTVDMVKRICHCSPEEAALLRSPAAPLVLLRLCDCLAEGGSISPAVFAAHPVLPVMRPFSMLHHLLMEELGVVLVAMYAGRFGGPSPTRPEDALAQLAGIADGFLVHNLPILRPMDDALVRIVAGRPMLLRSGRGAAPITIDMRRYAPPILALGSHLKNTITVAINGRAFVGPQMGDLETIAALDAFDESVRAIRRLISPTAEETQSECRERQGLIVACDGHPDFLSSQRAWQLAPAPVEVQHHHAHIAACMAEHRLDGEVLGVCWDGTGFGTDGTIWGGEFLAATADSFRRLAHMRAFRLPGAARAVREPRRSALGVLYEVFGDEVRNLRELTPIRSFTLPELETLLRMIRRSVNSPRTSSMGRLFDAVAALLDLRQTAAYEGQAAMELESLAAVRADAASYPFAMTALESRLEIDWTPMIRAIITDLGKGVENPVIAARFHRTLVEIVLAVARKTGRQRIVLTGGCFQNVLLLESAIESLRKEGFEPFWPQRVPPNDNGLSLGQAVVAGARARPED